MMSSVDIEALVQAGRTRYVLFSANKLPGLPRKKSTAAAAGV
jgi:hypothetical protein